MSRTMYDSTNPFDIPVGAEVVGGYIDGLYVWSAAGWQRHASAAKVRIAVSASTNNGNCLDVERGDAAPAEAPLWVRRRRARGVDPSVYMNASTWPAVRAAFAAEGTPEPHWWVASWGIGPTQIANAIGHQYAGSAETGHHYDLSVVRDYWPGVDPPPTVAPPPPIPVTGLDGARAAWSGLAGLLVNTVPQAASALALVSANLRTRI